jgi:hypothetical protein
LAGFITLYLGQAADAMPLQAAMQRRSREMWNSGLEGIEAIIERQERVLAKGDDQRFFRFAEHCRPGSLVPSEHRTPNHVGAI